MNGTSSHRWRRLWASGSPLLFAGGTALIVASLTALKEQPHVPWIFQGILIGGILGIALLVLQWRSEYRKRTFDPTWALRFGDRFDSTEMEEKRAKAARDLKEEQIDREGYNSPDIDDVLDFFEDLGFYLQGDQITPEVTHHAFYYWLRGYYSAAKPYIEKVQVSRPSQWECVNLLLETAHEIEVEKNKQKAIKSLDQNELRKFLNEEMNLLAANTDR